MTQHARTRFIVMDVDSTLIDEEVIDLLAQEAGVGARIAAITASAMRGEIDFRAALAQRVAMLKGLPTSVFAKVLGEVHFTPGAAQLVSTAHSRGWKVGVVSGGFHEVVDGLVSQLSIDYALANRLEVSAGFLTGRTQGQVIDKAVKLHTLATWLKNENLEFDQAVAVGDGANDIPMIQAAGLGIAFCAKPVVRAAADARIDERDLMQVMSIIDSCESTK